MRVWDRLVPIFTAAVVATGAYAVAHTLDLDFVLLAVQGIASFKAVLFQLVYTLLWDVYFQSSSLFGGGTTEADMCAQLSASSASFWMGSTANRAECTDMLERRFAAIVSLVCIPLIVYALWRLLSGFLWLHYVLRPSLHQLQGRRALPPTQQPGSAPHQHRIEVDPDALLRLLIQAQKHNSPFKWDNIVAASSQASS